MDEGYDMLGDAAAIDDERWGVDDGGCCDFDGNNDDRTNDDVNSTTASSESLTRQQQRFDIDGCGDDNERLFIPELASQQPHHPSQPNKTATEDSITGKKPFVDTDGSAREYDAPAPPFDLNWQAVDPVLHDWIECKETSKKRRKFGLDSNQRYILLDGGYPEEDFFLLDDTAQSARETDEMLLPFAIMADGSFLSDSPKWSLGVEEHLRRRGLILADSYAIRVGVNGALFGVRAFHIGFRYFVVVILGDIKIEKEDKFSDVEGCSFVMYSYVSITKEQAISNECS